MNIEELKDEVLDLIDRLDMPTVKSAHIGVNLMDDGVRAGYFVDGHFVCDLYGMLIGLAQGVPGVSKQSSLKVIHGITKNVAEYCRVELENCAAPENQEFHED